MAALEITTIEPKVEDFTPLSDHQQQTPDRFYSAHPVLHLYSHYASLSLSHKDLVTQKALQEITSDILGAVQEEYDKPSIDKDVSELQGTIVVTSVDVWVTSKEMILFAPQNGKGVIVPYQAIVVHAAEGDEVLLGLNLSAKDTPDEDMAFVQLRITPETSKKHPAHPDKTARSEDRGVNGEAQQTNGDAGNATPDLSLFDAISACQELNPDPPEQGDEDGAEFDGTAPGATDWITSENMADFMDENGEFRMPEGTTVVGDDGVDGTGVLGAGAGRTRRADEVDGQDGEGGEEDAKWQRTG